MEWRRVYHDRYEVSTSGMVRSVKTGVVLSPGMTSRGYLSVSLYDGNSPKRPKSFLVHRLVMEGYYGPSGLQVNHKDGDKTNNSLSNLEYATQTDNMRHAVDVLGRLKGERNPNSKLTDQQREEIAKSQNDIKELAEAYGITESWVTKLRLRYRNPGNTITQTIGELNAVEEGLQQEDHQCKHQD